MKSIRMLFVFLLAFTSVSAFADTYTCYEAVNSGKGYSVKKDGAVLTIAHDKGAQTVTITLLDIWKFEAAVVQAKPHANDIGSLESADLMSLTVKREIATDPTIRKVFLVATATAYNDGEAYPAETTTDMLCDESIERIWSAR